MRRGAVAGVALLAGILVGCASGGGDPLVEPGPGGADGTLAVFAAASLAGAFDELLADFAGAHPDVAIDPVVYDGSSTLVTQLAEGAAADVLATADEATMAQAVAAGLIVGEPDLFATNTLVIAVPVENPHGVTDLPDVLSLAYAICAEQVPCGSATAELFDAAGQVADPTSVEQNVTAVANRVSAGDVDAGFVYTTDVAARPELTAITPTAAQVTNSYPIGRTSDAPIAAEFLAFVRSLAGENILTSHGFGRP